jgi:hypothetical protein
MSTKHLLSISDLDGETIHSLVESAVAVAQGQREDWRPRRSWRTPIYPLALGLRQLSAQSSVEVVGERRSPALGSEPNAAQRVDRARPVITRQPSTARFRVKEVLW